MRSKYYSFLLGAPTVFGIEIWDVLSIGAIWAVIDFISQSYSTNSFLSLEILVPGAGAYLYYKSKFRKGYATLILKKTKYTKLEIESSEIL